jgi:hypothetical protein
MMKQPTHLHPDGTPRNGFTQDGEIDWEYSSGTTDGLTLRQWKADSERELVEEHGEEWLERNRARLDVEFEMMVDQGLIV